VLVILALIAVSAGQVAQADVPAEERRVLMEFYASTGGARWSDHTGWGTETSVCKWNGVWCDYPEGDANRPVVAGLSLTLNNLAGSIPASLAQLRHLQFLSLSGNRLSGKVPEVFLQRWDHHDFEFDAYGNGFSNLVVRATVRFEASGTLCSVTEDVRYQVAFDEPRNSAMFQSVRCVSPQSRETYCLVREGRSPSLSRLSRAIEALGFTTFDAKYDYPFTSTTHGVFLTTEAVWGNGTKRAVETYSGQGPIAVWNAQQLFLGLIPGVDWTRESRKAKCDFQR
jgi:hypothetical protein